MDTKKVVVEVNEEEVVEIDYRNWRGETIKTKIVPEHIFFGSANSHTEDQWFLNAYDLEWNDFRDFALKDIISWIPKFMKLSK